MQIEGTYVSRELLTFCLALELPYELLEQKIQSNCKHHKHLQRRGHIIGEELVVGATSICLDTERILKLLRGLVVPLHYFIVIKDRLDFSLSSLSITLDVTLTSILFCLSIDQKCHFLLGPKC